MAKLIRILAASLGGGMILGAGIRLGGQLASQRALRGEGSEGEHEAEKLSGRLSTLERRLARLEAADAKAKPAPQDGARQPGSPVEAEGLDSQAAEVSSRPGRQKPASSDGKLRAELFGWVDERLDERLGDMEAKLRTERDEAQRDMLNAIIESVQTRVIGRISRLEEEVAGHAAGMQELRECTLRSELSMQKLLGGIDRLIAAQPVRRERAAEPEASVEPEPARPTEVAKAHGAGNGDGAGMRERIDLEPRRNNGLLNLREPENGKPAEDAGPESRRRWSIFG